eukprot:2819786-Rhodomonas_salina.1
MFQASSIGFLLARSRDIAESNAHTRKRVSMRRLGCRAVDLGGGAMFFVNVAGPGCARAGFHCYFQQIASCQYEDAGNLEEVGAKDLVKQHLRMAGLAVDAHGRPNSNV